MSGSTSERNADVHLAAAALLDLLIFTVDDHRINNPQEYEGALRVLKFLKDNPTLAEAGRALLNEAMRIPTCSLGHKHSSTAMSQGDEQGPVFVLRLRSLPGVDAIRELRWILKRLLRDHHFWCVSINQEEDQKGELHHD
jgi:hypothetical protein